MSNYWGFRVDKNRLEYFKNELMNGRLRIGWSWDKRQDLRNLQMDQGAKANMPIFNKVKKDDILLVPCLPNWWSVAIVQATEDFNTGYKFELDENIGDYGNVFPAKYIKSFVRDSADVSGNIRLTLKNPSRFWNINHYKDDIEKLLIIEQTELDKAQDHKSRLEASIEGVFYEVFNEKKFSDQLYEKLTNQFSNEEWEFALIYGLRELFPYYNIERVGGKKEVEHGTDILITIPSIIPDFKYCIAIQVKDYNGFVSSNVIGQINKADGYWNSESTKLIEKIVIVTKADKELNPHLLNNESGVKIIFAKELSDLLSKIGQTFIGIK